MKIVIENGLWETDFLINDILPRGEVSHNLNDPSDVFVFASRAHSYNEILSEVFQNTLLVSLCPKI